jgi:tetratricopeptide (TPR) repeat protein
MMVRLAEDFVKSRQELADTDTPENDNDNDEEEVEFETIVVLKDIDPTDEAAIYRIQEALDEKGLKMADGVLRRLLEGCCPPKIKITRLSEDTMQTLLGRKKEGNQHFVEKGYREAIDCYDFALEAIPSHQRDELHVIPKLQLTELVNILSNKAECLLRKAKYEAAAEASTEALIFDNCHGKSRLRRAKAGLEVGMYDRYEATSRGDGKMTGVAYLVQAKHDLEDILENPESSSSSRTAAEKVMSKVDKLLAGAKKKVLGKDPDAEWDMTVLKIQSRCW